MAQSPTQGQRTDANRLVDETSPYLLQHAYNPVDWWPWSEEAVEHARDVDRPIFLSIGYSTCYWCHVMERECFEHKDVATVMNEHFVNIKVDREEHPDIDNIYMMALQALTGRGGWPMSMFIDPHTLRPLYGGTYFPKEPKQGLPSFEQVLLGVSNAWEEQRPALEENGEALERGLRRELASPRPAAPLGIDIAINAAQQLLSAYDAEHGGFGRAPKFPQPVFLQLLLAVRESAGDSMRREIDAAVTHTLDRMATGGMFDQVGGGFHRYSTDAKWLVPHFEKMLYDNAQLASVYADAAKNFDDPFYREVVNRTLDYVLTEMRTKDGAFASAQDAEVDAREGLNYLWTEAEAREALDAASREDLIAFALRAYGLDRGTNFQDPHHPDEPRRNVLFLTDRPQTIAEEMSLTRDEVIRRLKELNDVLYDARSKREQPGRDDKVLTSWNGLMIAAMAKGGTILDAPRFINAAADAANAILEHMRTDDGGLFRTARDGRASIDGMLEDYAFFIHGLIALHAATDDPKWIEQARTITEAANDRFFDDANGAYFDTLDDQPLLLIRTRTVYDGAVPSGNSVMLRNLLDLHDRTGEERHLDRAERTLEGISGSIARAPTSSALATASLARMARAFPDRVPQGGEIGEEARLAGLASISVDTRSVHPGPDPDSLTITLNVAEGHHVNAHDPGDDRLIGLLVYVTGGEGILAHPSYPPADVRDDGTRVYTGTVNIPTRVEAIGSMEGAPRLAVRWQACSETECLPPQEVTLDVEILANDGTTT